jgi:hypothetical protein
MSTDGTPTPAIPPEFLVTRQGSTFITYRGLIHLAHQQGLSATSTQLVQLPTAENGMTAVVQALVTTERGTFAGLGDASPGSVPAMIQPHLLRMAETRAIARALRVAVDAAFTALEELGDDAPAHPPPAPGPGPQGTDGIVIAGKRYGRDEVWRGYQQRRVQALNAGVVTTGEALAGLVPESRLADMAAAAQALKKRVEGAAAPAPDGAPPEDGRV